MPDDTGSGRWVTYAELAELRHISRKAAARLTLRHQWRRQSGNDGAVRVWVPEADLIPTPRHDVPSDTGVTGVRETVEAVLSTVREAHAAQIAALGVAHAASIATIQVAHDQAMATLRRETEALRDSREAQDRVLTEATARARKAEEALEEVREAEAARKAWPLIPRIIMAALGR
jgi:hypothetical protein